MSSVALDVYVATVRRSKLVDDDKLNDILREVEKDLGGKQQSADLARRLEDKKLVTAWQNEKLLAGKHKGFFLGKYKILGHLGTGGMSTVYLAEHTLMRRRVAIKVLPVARVNDSSYLDRFLREARAIAALDHPNIVRAFNVDNDKDLYYIVMEFVEGKDLEKVVQAGQLGYDKAADYIRQAAEGLSHAHAKGMIHRDIKPSNLLLDKEGTIKLLDMGLAMLTGRDERALTVEHKENVLGTTDYLAPEQAINSHLIDHRADIYSLGCTLYYLLTGHPPFPTGTLAQRLMKHQCEEPKPITDDRPDAPADLVEICRIMRMKKADDRYQTAAEVSEALLAWMRKHGHTPSLRRGASDHGTRAVGDESTVSLRLGGSSLELDRKGSSVRASSSGKSLPAAAAPAKPVANEPLSGFLDKVGQEKENSSILDTRTLAAGSSLSGGRRGSSVSKAAAASGVKKPKGLPPQVWAGVGGGVLVVLLVLFFVAGSPGNSSSAGGGSSGGSTTAGGKKRGGSTKTNDPPDFATFQGFPVGKLHELTFEAPAAGARNLALRVSDGPADSVARVLLNGKEIQKELKMPEIGIGPPKDFSLGRHDLKKGENSLSVEVSAAKTLRPSWVKYDPWQLIGPFPNDNDEGHDRVYPPEQEPFDGGKEYDGKGRKVKWEQKSYKDGDNHRLNDTFPGAKDNISYYLYRKVKADKAGQTKFFFGSDDSLKVWVNGKVVVNFKGGRGVEAYSNEATVDLKQGDNDLLLKVSQGGGDTGFTFTDVPNPNLESSSRQFRFGLSFPAK
jgi:serine/threonine-protein kinase